MTQTSYSLLALPSSYTTPYSIVCISYRNLYVRIYVCIYTQTKDKRIKTKNDKIWQREHHPPSSSCARANLNLNPDLNPKEKKKTPPRARHATTSSIISTSTTTTATISSNVLDRIPQVQVRVQVRTAMQCTKCTKCTKFTGKWMNEWMTWCPMIDDRWSIIDHRCQWSVIAEPTVLSSQAKLS